MGIGIFVSYFHLGIDMFVKIFMYLHFHYSRHDWRTQPMMKIYGKRGEEAGREVDF